MALQNGVLVHGRRRGDAPCATRTGRCTWRPAGSRTSPRRAAHAGSPRPDRLAEAFALLPTVRRAIPQARFPFERPSVLGAILGTAVAARALRRSRLSPGTREVAAAGVAFLRLRSRCGVDLAAYHGAEHISDRHLRERRDAGAEGASALRLAAHRTDGRVVARRERRRVEGARRNAWHRAARRDGGAIGGSVEVFSWVARNPEHPLARVLARPGFELQRHLSTAEPSGEQLEVANAARDACLALERTTA